jgi:hypothetical protein
MPLTKKKLICASFLPLIIFLSFAAARAQTAVSYQFLEVVDSQGKPVADATVETSGYKQTFRTDENGRIEKLPIWYGDYNTTGFTVSKTGYYPFRYEFGKRFSPRIPIRIELLKFPQTEAERRTVENEQRRREFFAAARTADVEAVRKFLKSGLSANLSTSDLRGSPEERDIPIIVFAAKSGDSRTVNEFLAAGAEVRKIPDILITYLTAPPLMRDYPERETDRRRLLNAYEATAESLIKAGAIINPSASAETTPLILAAERGYIKTAALLIEKGARVDDVDYMGWTALVRVVNNRDLRKVRFEMADLLLKSGADINFKTKYYEGCRTALMYAAWNVDPEMVKYLLASRADAAITCENGDSALKLVKNRRTYDKSNAVEETIKLLEAAGAKE